MGKVLSIFVDESGRFQFPDTNSRDFNVKQIDVAKVSGQLSAARQLTAEKEFSKMHSNNFT